MNILKSLVTLSSLFTFASSYILSTVECISSECKFEINCDSSISSWETNQVNLSASTNENLTITNMRVEVSICKDIFKKPKNINDNFKYDSHDLGFTQKIIQFDLKNKKNLKLTKNENQKIISFDLETKDVPNQTTSINFEIKYSTSDSPDIEFRESIKKEISIENKTPEISNIIIVDHPDFKFDKNKKEYFLNVSSDTKYIELEVTESQDRDSLTTKLRKKLGSSGSEFTFEIGDYKLKIFRMEKTESSKKKENKNKISQNYKI